MSGRLEGRVAVVTGAGRGIGRGVAMLLADEGASVVVNDFGVNVDGSAPSSGPAAEVADEIKAKGGKAVPNFDTVATVDGGESLIKTALDNFGRLDILVNVAGILRDRMIFNMSEQEWDDVVGVHLKGHYCTTKPASIVFRQQRHGRIINFSSISGLGGLPGQANYGAAKAGIAGFTRVVARDLGRYGVTCNAIAPGAATRMTATVPANTAQLRARAGTAPVVAERPPSTVPPMREPEYVAPMTVFLACDEAWNINGKIFYVAGGRISLAHEESAMRQIQKVGMWTIDELRELVPSQLTYGMVNPAPPPPDLS
ncbi:MAG TPA: SDR family NAD(P)-dependent oxidoreductase, partial [Dehalococcoidia bacterium]